MQTLSANFAVNFAGSSTDVSLDESWADLSFTKRPLVEDDHDASSSDQVKTAIEYISKVMDFAIDQQEISKAENNSLTAEAEILKLKLEETNIKYDGMVETLDAKAADNRVLCEERDALKDQVVSLTERVTKADDDLSGLIAKIDEQMPEIQSLRKTEGLWRKRCDNLLERNYKTPVEFKRLQTECGNVLKMLTGEMETKRLKSIREIMEQKESEIKEICKKLTDAETEVTKLKDKETQVRNKTKHYHDTYVASRDKVDEFAEFKAQIGSPIRDLKRPVDDWTDVASHTKRSRLNKSYQEVFECCLKEYPKYEADTPEIPLPCDQFEELDGSEIYEENPLYGYDKFGVDHWTEDPIDALPDVVIQEEMVQDDVSSVDVMSPNEGIQVIFFGTVVLCSG